MQSGQSGNDDRKQGQGVPPAEQPGAPGSSAGGARAGQPLDDSAGGAGLGKPPGAGDVPANSQPAEKKAPDVQDRREGGT